MWLDLIHEYVIRLVLRCLHYLDSLMESCYFNILANEQKKWSILLFLGRPFFPGRCQRFFFLHSFLLYFSLWSYESFLLNLSRCNILHRAVRVAERGICGDLDSKNFPSLLCIAENCKHSGFSSWLSINLHHILAHRVGGESWKNFRFRTTVLSLMFLRLKKLPS